MADKYKINKPTIHKIVLMVAALLCSLLLWVYVTETEGDEIEQTFSGVKVVFEGETNMRDTKDLIITSCDTTSVKLTIKGSRRTVANLEAADMTAVIDLSTITKTGNYSLSYKINYPNGVDAESLTATVRTPSTIGFFVDKLSSKTVEVRGVFNGSAAEGFSAEPLEFTPSTVKISGPESELALVDHAWVEVDKQDVDKTTSFDTTYQLRDKDGNLIDNDDLILESDTVSVTLPIISIKEVDLTLDFISGGGATADDVKWSIEPARITLSGDSEALAGLNNITLDKIDLSKIKDTYTETYTIVIPNDTEIMNGAKEATVTLELVGLKTRTVSISQSNLSLINVTEGYEATIMVDSLDNVVIRGKESVLKNISEASIRAVGDLSEFGTATGILAVPVKIVIDGTTDAGAVGLYEIYVDVRKAE